MSGTRRGGQSVCQDDLPLPSATIRNSGVPYLRRQILTLISGFQPSIAMFWVLDSRSFTLNNCASGPAMGRDLCFASTVPWEAATVSWLV